MTTPPGSPEFNTFTVLARCEETGALGVALASSPLTVASRCPYLRGGVAAVSTQAFTDPRHGPVVLDLLGHGYAPADAIEALRARDRWFERRQVGIVTQAGEVAVHSGREGRPWTGHMMGEGFACMGNNLVGAVVIDDMAAAFTASHGNILEERLMRALEAGSAAGGEAAGQLSAGILVAEPGQRARTDLRVEMANPTPEEGGDAVVDLRRVLDAFAPMIRYYQVWPDNPAMASWREWRDAQDGR